MKQESCNVYQWVQNFVEFLPIDSGAIMPAADLYEAYCLKEKYPHRAVEFFRRLSKHPKMTPRKGRLKSVRFYKAVGIRAKGQMPKHAFENDTNNPNEIEVF